MRDPSDPEKIYFEWSATVPTSIPFRVYVSKLITR